MKHFRLKRTLAALLACAMVLGLGPVAAYATGSDGGSPVSFQELDPQQVSAELISLDQKTVVEPQSMYADTDTVRATIVLEDKPAISTNVEYGKLDEIEQMPGVKAVYLETRYEPLTADTIHKATVTGGVDGLTEVETQSANSSFVSWYKPE